MPKTPKTGGQSLPNMSQQITPTEEEVKLMVLDALSQIPGSNIELTTKGKAALRRRKHLEQDLG